MFSDMFCIIPALEILMLLHDGEKKIVLYFHLLPFRKVNVLLCPMTWRI